MIILKTSLGAINKSILCYKKHDNYYGFWKNDFKNEDIIKNSLHMLLLARRLFLSVACTHTKAYSFTGIYD